MATGESNAGVLPLLGSIAVQLIGGILVGLLVGWVAGKVSRRITLPSGNLYAIAAMAWAVTAYGTGAWIGVSGFSAVYIAAVIIGVGLQKLQNKFTEWWDTRRGYAETP